jgi:hypothetical protein
MVFFRQCPNPSYPRQAPPINVSFTRFRYPMLDTEPCQLTHKFGSFENRAMLVGNDTASIIGIARFSNSL